MKLIFIKKKNQKDKKKYCLKYNLKICFKAKIVINISLLCGKFHHEN